VIGHLFGAAGDTRHVAQAASMWLLPVLNRVASAVTRTFYRLTIAGESVPVAGPLLLVANHPNSLLDPAMVAVAANRPVRFLAKAPLFTDKLIGWLVKAAGAIPVYRHRDDPGQTARNNEMFSAVRDALTGGDAVGIFPEGISHSEPSMSALKTGAARIALDAAGVLGAPIPIVPVGLVFRARDIFRSEAKVVVGEAIAWADLASRGSGDAEAVRDLTARIDAALRRVTVNLESWEDAPIVESAEAIHAAEFGAPANAAEQVERLATTTAILKRLRDANDPRWAALAEDLNRHQRLLRRLGLKPSELHGNAKAGEAIKWTFRQLPYSGLIPIVITIVGSILFWVPYRLTGIVATRTAPQKDTVSTHKTMYGIVIFAVWIVFLTAVVWFLKGWIAGVVTLVLLPVVGFAVLFVGERWRDAFGEAQRFVLRVRRGELIEEMKRRQRELAGRLEAIRQEGA
jgi:glycerol-3-phosphate O-acyltransferase / dihydroxyacetone phosphate acyltransferase